MSKVVLIIGAGQLGSRHLQGILKLKETLEIYVVDPSMDSLAIAQERGKEISGNSHRILFTTNWADIPHKIDISIIATGANVREKIVIDLLKGYEVRYLVLEKILFQNLKAYENVRQLIQDLDVKTWVNHPRRMFSHFKEIKEQLKPKTNAIFFSAIGANWGLGCNGLHFLDLFSYLAESEVESIDGLWINDELYESKRKGYFEFTGSLKGKFKNGHTFQIASFNGDPGPVTINISDKDNRWFIQEGVNTNIVHLNIDNAFKMDVSSSTMSFQSSLTEDLVRNILLNGGCDLPTYVEAAASHIPFLDIMLRKYIELSGVKTDSCPIT